MAHFNVSHTWKAEGNQVPSFVNKCEGSNWEVEDTFCVPHMAVALRTTSRVYSQCRKEAQVRHSWDGTDFLLLHIDSGTHNTF